MVSMEEFEKTVKETFGYEFAPREIADKGLQEVIALCLGESDLEELIEYLQAELNKARD